MERINFRQQRDFGEIMGVTFSFIRQNFVKLLKPIAIIAGLPLLVGGILMGSGYASLIRFSDFMDPGSSTGIESLPQILFGYLFITIGSLAFYLTVNTYIKLYTDGVEDISTGAIFNEVKKQFWTYLGAGFISGIMIMLGLALCIIPGIYLIIILAPLFIIITIENVSIFEAISRAFKLIKNEWWATFGLYFVVYMIQSFIAMIFAIPMYIIQFAMIFSPIIQDPSGFEDDPDSILNNADQSMQLLAIYMPIYFFGVMLTTMLIVVAVAFKYMSLVESKEGVGEIDKISQIGSEE